MAATTTTNAVPAHHGPNLSPGDSGTLFVESLVILALSIVGTAAVMLGVLHRKYDRAGHAQYAERWRRHREIRKFLDFTVRVWFDDGGLVASSVCGYAFQAGLVITERVVSTHTFMDITQVLILLGFELVQSVNWLAGTILSEKLYSEVRLPS
jgi:hypothetical protein